uniref:Uncharacterized protein n=1 Tax=Anguilla anguilla TaxID=7936 RepID=A0A0E9X5E6_ANGAN
MPGWVCLEFLGNCSNGHRGQSTLACGCPQQPTSSVISPSTKL